MLIAVMLSENLAAVLGTKHSDWAAECEQGAGESGMIREQVVMLYRARQVGNAR